MGKQVRAHERENLFGPVVLANIAKGETISRDSYDSAMAQRPRHVLEFKQVFSDVDALITPTMPMIAPSLDSDTKTYDRGFQFNLPFSFMGLPSLSVPCGFNSEQMPVGMLITANALQERLVLRIAAAYEADTQFYKYRAPTRCVDT
jgi:aspartyl-tRNA(Asn)/glutamyl-tRNA(Gln) amidotransferase subunit A